MDLFALPSLILLVVKLATFVLQAFAFVDALTHRAEAYVAADKLTKPAWCIILGVATASQLVFRDPINLFNLAGTIAALVYVLDVRPTLRELSRRR